MSSHHHEHEPVAGSLSMDEAAAEVRTADCILIGAGAGLPASAGFDYTDPESFARLFPVLKRAGIKARYEMIGRQLPPRYLWGYWAVHVQDVRFGDDSNSVYRDLRDIVGAREHFVLSSNVDGLFVRNGFDSERVFTPQGDYALYQCLTPCSRDVWDSRPIIEEALRTYDEHTGEVAAESVPHCPRCGGPVFLNVYAGAWYIADHFMRERRALNRWLDATVQEGRSLAVIEIGAGFNTPGVVRLPLEVVVESVPNATLVRINRDHAEVPHHLADRAASLGGDAIEIIRRLRVLLIEKE